MHDFFYEIGNHFWHIWRLETKWMDFWFYLVKLLKHVWSWINLFLFSCLVWNKQCVCEREWGRERDKIRVWVHVCKRDLVCVWVWVRVCQCVWEKERYNACMCVCMCMCMCVYVSMRVWVRVWAGNDDSLCSHFKSMRFCCWSAGVYCCCSNLIFKSLPHWNSFKIKTPNFLN